MIRRYQAGDEIPIGQIFHDAIHQLAIADYTSQQLNAWSGRHAGSDHHWKKRCERKKPFVNEIGGQVVGFIEFDPDGHIDCTYVDPAHAGKGLMTELMNRVKEEAIGMGLSHLFAEVSKTARSFFERNGFVWVRDNRVIVHGISIENYIMNCDLIQKHQRGGSSYL